MPHLEESDPAAQALKYVHDAASVDAGTRGGAERNCANCRFFGDASGGWGSCQLFPGKAVNADGWCAGWAAMG